MRDKDRRRAMWRRHIVSCVGKKQYPTYTAAARSARHVRMNHKNGAPEAYLCRVCGAFHVGNPGPFTSR